MPLKSPTLCQCEDTNISYNSFTKYFLFGHKKVSECIFSRLRDTVNCYRMFSLFLVKISHRCLSTCITVQYIVSSSEVIGVHLSSAFLIKNSQQLKLKATCIALLLPD